MALLSPPTPVPPLSFFFPPTAPTHIYPLSLHDALPISRSAPCSTRAPSSPTGRTGRSRRSTRSWACTRRIGSRDRKSTRLNSSHSSISYAVFCLKKKKKGQTRHPVGGPIDLGHGRECGP